VHSIMGSITTHSTGLAIRLSVRLHLDCSPVNSGVRRPTGGNIE
jgi:hypothetical protein